MSFLTAHNGASIPLWLAIACEELRVYGDFSTLTKKIKSIPGTLEGLLSAILDRLLKEDDTNCLHKVSVGKLIFDVHGIACCVLLYEELSLNQAQFKLGIPVIHGDRVHFMHIYLEGDEQID